MMAVGLNIVVGYAGLLDLGYVAFYAIGAYTAAWFASPQFARRGRQRPSRLGRRRPERGGIHVSIWLVLDLAGIITGDHRRPDRPADAAAARRLPRDRHARLRRDHAPDRAQRRQPSARLQPDERPAGDQPDRPAWLRQPASPTGPACPGLPSFNSTFLGREIGGIDVFYWTALGLLLFTIFCSIRLRDSRLGRAWIAIREDEIAAAAMGVPLMRTKTWAYASGAFFGGIAGAWFALFKRRDVPGRLLLQHLGLHPLHGHPRRDGQRLGRDPRRRLPRVPEPGGPREHRRLAQRATSGRTSTCRSYSSSASTG